MNIILQYEYLASVNTSLYCHWGNNFFFLCLLCREIKFLLILNLFPRISIMLYLPFAAVPSAPRNVISSVNETSLVLEWSEPRDLGGREDIFYNVICKKCLPERGMCSRCDDNVDISPRHLGLTQRRVAVRNLQAHTQYSFEIQAVNGVSNKSPYAPQFSTVNITTNQAGRCSSSLVFGIRTELSGTANFQTLGKDTKESQMIRFVCQEVGINLLYACRSMLHIFSLNRG